MSVDGDDSGGSYLPSDEEREKHTTNESGNASGATGQEGPDATHENASNTTNADRLSCTEQRRDRGRMRDLDHHASWRDVYAANHVERWRDE